MGAASPNSKPDSATEEPVSDAGVPVLELADRLHKEGKYTAALEQYARVQNVVETVTTPTLGDEQVWLRAAQGSVESALSAKQTDYAIKTISKIVPRFKQNENWSELAHKTDQIFKRLIRLAVDSRKPEDALGIFEKARRYVTLDADLRRSLVDASMALDETDKIGTAYLCLDDLLLGSPRSPEEFERITEFLRKILRIDLAYPAEADFDERRSLLERVREVGDFPWVDAYLAMADLRDHRIFDAFAAITPLRSRQDLDDELRGLTAVVEYHTGRWASALKRVEGLDDPRWKLLNEISRLCLYLNGQHKLKDSISYRKKIEAHLSAAAELLRDDVWDLDTRLVIACCQVIVERVQEFTSGLKQWNPNDLKPWMVPLLREGVQAAFPLDAPDDQIGEAEAEIPRRCRIAMLCGCAINRGDTETAKLHLNSTKVSAGKIQERTEEFGLLARCLERELGFQDSRPKLPAIEIPSRKPEIKNAGQLRLWQSRIDIHQALDAGRFDLVEKFLKEFSDPAHPTPAWDRLATLCERVRLETSNPDSTAAADTQSAAPANEPIERKSHAELLAEGLWLIESSQQESGQHVLNSLAEDWKDCLESRLANVELDTDEQKINRLSKMRGQSLWELSPRRSLLRPWRHRVPTELWKVSAAVSPHRMADLLHAVDLQLAENLFDVADDNLRIAEVLWNEEAAVPLKPLIGQRCSKLSLLRLDSDAESACRSHQRALGLGHHNAEFPQRLAESLSETEAAGDAVLKILLGATSTEASESQGEIPRGIVADCLLKLTRVVESSPADLDELKHRMGWLEKIVDAHPKCDEARRSLAWGHRRDAAHKLVLKITDPIKEKLSVDRQLRGDACWALRRFDDAAIEFEAGNIPGWAGCAHAAARLQKIWKSPVRLRADEAAILIGRLDASPFGDEAPPRILLWQAVVHLAANAAANAKPPLEAAIEHSEGLTEEEHAWANCLLGLVFWQQGKSESAEEHWQAACGESLCSQWALPLATLCLLRHSDWGNIQRVHERSLEFQRRGMRSLPFQILRAHLEARQGITERLSEDLPEFFTEFEREDNPLAAPFGLVLAREGEFLNGRLALQQHRSDDALEAWSDLSSENFFEDELRFWRAVARNELKQEVRDELEQLVATDSPLAADAGAQLAVMDLSDKRVESARKHTAQVLADDENHPRGLVAQALIDEAAGRPEAAILMLEAVRSREAWQVPRPLRVNVLLAESRLRDVSGDVTGARECLEQACQLDRGNEIAAKRLALLNSRLAMNDEEMRRTEVELVRMQQVFPDNPDLALARAVLAEGFNDLDSLAARIREVFRLPRFSELPPALRRKLAIHGADLQLRRREFGAAAEALERLLEEAPANEIEQRLRRCRLLQAIQEIGVSPLPNNALERVFAAAAAVCQGDDVPPVAIILRMLAGVLAGTITSPEEKAAEVPELAQLDISEQDPLYELKLIAGKLFEDAALSAEFETRFSAKDDPLRRCVDLLSGSLNCNTDVLHDEAVRLVKGGEGGVFDVEELVAVAIVAAKAQQADEVIELVAILLGAGSLSTEMKDLTARMFAKRAVFLLKKKELLQAWQLLERANELIAGGSFSMSEDSAEADTKEPGNYRNESGVPLCEELPLETS